MTMSRAAQPCICKCMFCFVQVRSGIATALTFVLRFFDAVSRVRPKDWATHSRSVLPHGRTSELTSATSHTPPARSLAAVLSCASTSVDAFESGSTCRCDARFVDMFMLPAVGTSGDPQLSRRILTSASVVVQITQERRIHYGRPFFELTSSGAHTPRGTK